MAVQTVEVSVPMTGGVSERMTALVSVDCGDVWLELATPGGSPSGSPMRPAEALQLSQVLESAARQALGR